MNRADKIIDKRGLKGTSMLTLKVLMILTMAVLISCGAAMDTSTAWSGEQSKREALIAAIPKGDTFDNDGTTYAWLPTLRAARQEDKTNLSRKETDLIDRQLIEQKGRFKIYGTATRRAMSRGEESATKPVALNMHTKSLAVITGNLWLKLKDMQNARSIAVEYGLVFDFANDAMRTAFYKAPADADIKGLRERLQADPRIERVTLDMVDRIRRPH